MGTESCEFPVNVANSSDAKTQQSHIMGAENSEGRLQGPALDLASLAQQLEQVIANPDAVGENEKQKNDIMNLARGAFMALQNSFETAKRILYSVCPPCPSPLLESKLGRA